MTKRYKVDLAVGGHRDTVYTFPKATEADAIRYAVGIMKLQYRQLHATGYFVYSVESLPD